MAALYRQVLETASGAARDGTGAVPASPPAVDPADRSSHQWTLRRRRLGSVAAAWLRALLRSRAERCFGILLYHRVVALPHGVPLPEDTVTPATFREQMDGLLTRGYKPWPLSRAVACHAAGRPIPPKTFVVTFDDGYKCLYHEAWPILKELAIPATIFLVTAYLDSHLPMSFCCRAGEGVDGVPVTARCSLSTGQCNEMLAGGLVEFGTHTHTHADFRGRPEAFRSDLQVSLEVMQRRFNLEGVTFAFPFGHCGAALAGEAKRAGLLCALTTKCELVTPQSDPFEWGRFTAEPYDTAATLAAKLDGWYGLLQRSWHRWRRKEAIGGAVCP